MPEATFPNVVETAPVSAGVRASMRSNRRRDTGPEKRIRSALHRRGYRFRVDHPLRLEGALVRPDVVFTRAKVAVFVDGCFWHSCPLHGTSPRSNRDYWGPKLARNAERDRANTVALRRDGWRVVRIWEHDDVETGLRAIEDALFSAGSP
jgi:DNA mismatch endonuclease, patch repair protein